LTERKEKKKKKKLQRRILKETPYKAAKNKIKRNLTKEK